MPSALETPWVTLKVNDVPLLLCNDLGRPTLRKISWSSFFFTTSSAFSIQVVKPWIRPVNVSIMTNRYFYLEKLASGWSPSASPLLAGPTPLDGLGQLGSLSSLWGFSWQVGQEETTCHIVVWRPVLLKDLSSNLWRAFSPKWVVACKELTNFHWRFPGRKKSPSYWNHPI